MLYITTRTSKDAHTAPHTLKKDRGPEGGLYVPLQLTAYTPEQVMALKEKTFCQCVADILDLFFSARMSSWDVECCIGKRPVRLMAMNRKILMAEAWHNSDLSFRKLVRSLSARLQERTEETVELTSWAWITARVAVLFGVFSDLLRAGIADVDRPIDIAVAAGDFTAPMAIWYARKMGLPIGTVICACDESSDIWDLMYHGELKTKAPVPTGLERLIFETLGANEVKKYIAACERGRMYSPPEGSLDILRKGIYTAVVSPARRDSVISSVYRTSAYSLDDASALAYAGIQDYRATSRESRGVLILAEQEGL